MIMNNNKLGGEKVAVAHLDTSQTYGWREWARSQYEVENMTEI